MRARADIAALRKIAAVRAVQQAAAEAEAASAAAARATCEKALSSRAIERDGASDGWAAAIGSPQLMLEVSRQWSTLLVRREATVRDAQSKLDRAEKNLELRAGEMNRATRLRDAVASRLRCAIARRANDRAERSLADALDRHVQRWVAP